MQRGNSSFDTPSTVGRDQGGNAISVVVAGGGLPGWKGLKSCFAKDAGFLLVSCSDAPDEVLSLCRKLRPSVLIVDQAFVENVAPDQFSSVIGFGQLIRVLIRVHTNDSGALERLLRMGCTGFVGERCSRAILRRAVRVVASGEFWASRRLISRMLQEALFDGSRRLTEREREILRFIGLGYKNQEIATQLCISRETVRWHVRSLYAKLGVQDRLSAAIYAREPQLEKPEPRPSPIRKPPQGLKPIMLASVG